MRPVRRGSRVPGTWLLLGTLAACGGGESGSGTGSPPQATRDALVWRAARDPLPALPQKLQLAEGLTMLPFAAEPLLQNPVAFDIDPGGRVFVAETHRYLRSVFDITQQPAWLRDDLSFRTESDRRAFLEREFAADPSLLRADSEVVRALVDDDGDGRADRSAVVASGFDSVTAGTAASVLALGTELWFTCIPDLWRISIDDDLSRAARPESIAHGFGVHIGVTGHDLHGLVLGPDGRIWFSLGDRGAHLTTREGRVVDLPDTGSVWSCETDGSDLRVFATGLRNPQELAFDDLGNLFTDDNDTAGADASRVLYVVDGGDYGWRCSYQHMVGFGPWIEERVWEGGVDGTLPTAGFAAQGPSGLACYPGTGFAAGQDGRMFVCDFPGGVLSFGLEARGAGFRVTDVKRVAWSLWPTDLCFGPDGALWILDWVAGWQKPDKGRIHRLFDPVVRDDLRVHETRDLLAAGMKGRPVAALTALFAHPDRRVRTQAHLECATRGDEAVTAMQGLLDSDAPLLPRLHALWGLCVAARHGSTRARAAVAAALFDAEGELRAQAARLCGELEIKETAERLSIVTADGYPRERFFAAIALGHLGDARFSSRVLAMLQANDGADAFLTHAGVEAITGCMSEDELAGLALDPVPAVRRAGMLALRRLASPKIARFLDDAEERIRVEAARAIHDVPIGAAFAALADRADAAALDVASRSRAIDCALRSGRPADADRLARIAADRRLPVARRAQALDGLAEFAAPSPIDAVVGLWRPVARRDAKPARAALAGQLDVLIAEPDAVVLEACIRAARALEVAESVPLLAEAVRGGSAAGLRALALEGCAELGDQQLLDTLLPAALDAPEPVLRIAALRLLPRSTLADAATLLASAAGGDAETEVRRAAIVALGALGTRGVPALGSLLRDLEAVPAALRLDVVDAALANGDAALADALAGRDRAQPEGDRLARFRLCLDGGDPGRGRVIFESRQDVACVRCHQIAGVGGTVGPSLDHLASRAKPEEILESVLYPMARITEGYPPAMPDAAMHALKRGELRDLIAWLRSLR